MSSDTVQPPDMADQTNPPPSTQPLRVAHFLAHYPALEGTSSFCRGLTRALNRAHPGSSMIITFKEQKKEPHPEEVLLCYKRPSLNPFTMPEELIEDLRTNKHDLDGIVLHGVYNAKAAGMRRVLERLNIPYIFVPHDPYTAPLRHHHGIRKWFFWHLFEKHTIDGSRAVQLLDPSHEKYLREMGRETRIEVIPNGCEVERLSQVPTDAHTPGSQTEMRIQYLGRMDRNHKGLDLLIQGFAKWKAQHPDKPLKLYLTGNDWEDREELETLAKEVDPGGSIVFTGPRAESSMEIVAEADIVVLASRFDGFGLCIVEAMLAGRPVLVSDQAGIASHIERSDGGWLMEPNIDDIASAMDRILEDREQWAEKGKKGQDYVMNHLTWDQIADQTQHVYDRCFGKRINPSRLF